MIRTSTNKSARHTSSEAISVKEMVPSFAYMIMEKKKYIATIPMMEGVKKIFLVCAFTSFVRNAGEAPSRFKSSKT